MATSSSTIKYCIRFSLCGAAAFTAATAIAALLSKNYPFGDWLFRIIVSLPWVVTWILEGVVYSYHPYRDGGFMEKVLANTGL
jgi:ABC-type sugar transport system permease subunit